MINSKIERKAVLSTAILFNEIGWLFREQPIMDFGIDATVETAVDSRPEGKFIALQIKGGHSNFRKNKSCLTHYFDTNHKDYWFKVGKSFPIILILQDPATNILYWREIDQKTVLKTIRRWKIEVPLNNQLTIKSKDKLLRLINSHHKSPDFSTKYYYLIHDPNSNTSEVTFKNQKEHGLLCMINTEDIKIELPLMYYPKKDEWSNLKNDFTCESCHIFTLATLKKYLLSRIQILNSLSTAEKLLGLISSVEELKNIAIEKSINGIEEFLFDSRNKGKDIPKLSRFIEAFEQYIEIQDVQYEILLLEHSVVIITDDNEYEIETDEGRVALLKSIIEDRSYEDIAALTDSDIWNQIYIDPEIEKDYFIPVIFNLWENYWDTLYKNAEIELGCTDHLDLLKASSKEQLIKFKNGYDNTQNVIDYASELDYSLIFPMSVVAMLKIYNSENCYEEYCMYEFDNEKWKWICLNEDEPDCQIFYIKVNEDKFLIA